MLANFIYSFKRFLKNVRTNLKHRVRFIFRSLLVCFGVWILVFANYGIIDYYRLQKESKELEAKLMVLKAEKEELLKLVRAISGPAVDVQLLEMQLRKVLAYARSNEQVFFWK